MIENLEARQMLARVLPFPVIGPVKPRTQIVAHQTQTAHHATGQSGGHSEGVSSIALTQPTRPDLADASDHGFLNNDDITNETSPTISGTATPTTLVEVLLNDVVVTTVATDFNGVWSTTLNGLNDGLSAITVRETDGLGTHSATSEPLNLSIDTVRPAMLSSAFFWQHSPHLVRMNFSETITPSVGPTSLTATNLTQETTLDSALLSASFSTLVNVLNIGFSGLANQVVSDGNWRITLGKELVTDRAGNSLQEDAVTEFFFLTGDANRDRRVDGGDLDILVSHMNQFVGSFSDGDFNYDSFVDLADAQILMTRWLTQLPPPALPKMTPMSLASTSSRPEQRQSLAAKLGNINATAPRVLSKI